MSRSLIALFACLALFAATISAGPQLQGSGTLKSEPRETGAFTGIRTHVSADVIVQIGDKQSVVVEADDNLLPIVVTRVEGDMLEITTEESFSTRKGIKVTITVPELKKVEVQSSGDFTVSGLKTQSFEVEIQGSGDVNLEGTCAALNIEVQGSGDVEATKLQAIDAKVAINGSGDAKVNVTNSLDAAVNGSGDIQYAGNPKDVQKQVNGSGSIKEK